MDISRIREHYVNAGLSRDDLADDPITQFKRWFEEWVATNPYDANAVIVATTDSEGWPSARAVLLKKLDERGFVFYTNRQSAKGIDLEESGRAALCFLWHSVERQVRVVGQVEHLLDNESDEYFSSRPRGAQIAAWASPQSQVINNRAELEHRNAAAETHFQADTRISRPPHWGGYLVRPHIVEFWQGRRNRLHDRLRYRKAKPPDNTPSHTGLPQHIIATSPTTRADTACADWIVERLAP
ncbi:MAG: pyridoxamine 5'-phosphate oxidase [Acidimicrobiaceae bacterium]|nr:pyridoxamine 5'-phosphate oxidase [Acidimicrobiaceae bacterium]